MNDSPEEPEFWNQRYEAGRTPWDLGRVPAALRRFLAANPGRGQTVLIPGCGSGYEIEAFAAAGYSVTAIDISAAAVARAQARVAADDTKKIQLVDFFAERFEDAPFNCIYERTFLCALPPARWPEIVARSATLLKAGGLLFGFYFFGDKDDGPPFGLTPGEDTRLFDACFELVDNQPSEDALPLFASGERWQVRRRRDRADVSR